MPHFMGVMGFWKTSGCWMFFCSQGPPLGPLGLCGL
jgi:hypothetical protein